MRRAITYFLLLAGIACTCAQDFSARNYPAQQDFQSHQIITSGTNYNGTVYAPFDNTTPSEQSEVGASYSPAKAPSGPRRSFDTGPEHGRDEQYPVGEPWVLLAFAAVFAGGIALRRRKRTV